MCFHSLTSDQCPSGIVFERPIFEQIEWIQYNCLPNQRDFCETSYEIYDDTTRTELFEKLFDDTIINILLEECHLFQLLGSKNQQ